MNAESGPAALADPPAQRTELCRSCGAPLEQFDRFCQCCGTPREAAAPAPAAAPQRRLRCENCSAEIAVDPGTRSVTCPFCDSNYVVDQPREATGKQPPEFVIGFAIAPPEALDRFQKWLGSNSWLRPGDLRRAELAEKLRGVYLPFWSFSMLAESRWTASIGEYWYRTETYTTVENGKTVTRTRTVRETEWWNLAGRHHEYHSGYLVSGSRGLPQHWAERIMPFRLEALKRYQPYFLAGWTSEEYSVERDEALPVCQQEFCRREQQAIAAFLPGDTHTSLEVATEFDDVNSDLVLLPVYILAYRYGEKVYRYVLNGQTGREAGDKPWSWRRIGLAVAGLLIAAIVVALLLAWFNR